MGNARFETKKRMNIVRKIIPPIKSMTEGIILGGSMGYGQNYSVTKKSDIDMSVLIKKDRLDQLLSTWYFKDQVSAGVQKLFKDEKINSFWVSRVIDSVKVNVFIYDVLEHRDFCLLEGNAKGFTKEGLNGRFEGYDFEGQHPIITYLPKEFEDGVIYEKPCLISGKYWFTAPRNDFYYSAIFLYQKTGYLDSLEREVWKATIKQLVKEQGRDADLNKANVLNSHFVYQTNSQRLPREIVSKIQERTKKELQELVGKTGFHK